MPQLAGRDGGGKRGPGGRPSRRALLLGVALIAAVPAGGFGRPAAAEFLRYDVAIAQGRVVDGPEAIRLTQGDSVEIRWTSDAPMTLHLHGYDIEAVAAPGAPGRMAFRAHAAGRFPVEVHGAAGEHRTLLYLDVYPR